MLAAFYFRRKRQKKMRTFIREPSADPVSPFTPQRIIIPTSGKTTDPASNQSNNQTPPSSNLTGSSQKRRLYQSETLNNPAPLMRQQDQPQPIPSLPIVDEPTTQVPDPTTRRGAEVDSIQVMLPVPLQRMSREDMSTEELVRLLNQRIQPVPWDTETLPEYSTHMGP
jgi:hypothetical protein